MVSGKMPKNQTGRAARSSLFRTIATDVHFWIPLLVLLAGLVLLHELR
jgi:hypothetical protein